MRLLAVLESIHAARNEARFAFAAGIVGPLLCLGFDPVLFQGGDEHGPILGRYWVAAYCFMGLEMLMLAVWLAGRGRLGAWSCIVGGFLFVGAMLAAGLGVFILPLSVIGLLILIGVLGFIPFITAYAFFCQALVALRVSRGRGARWQTVAGFVLGAALAGGLPTLTQVEVHRRWRAAVRAVAEGNAPAPSRVEFWSRLVDAGGEDSPLDEAIDDEPDTLRKGRLIELRERPVD